jgi:acetyl esterase/lipase
MMKPYLDRIAKMRRSFERNMQKRDAALSIPPDICCDWNIPYGSDPKWQKLDVYRPYVADGIRLPVLLHVHGGAWIYGEKEGYRYYCMELARHGFCVINFSYRPAPYAAFPAQLEDTCLVLDWIAASADSFTMDADCLFGMGDSAGAHILSLTAAAKADHTFGETFPFSMADTLSFRALCFNCGSYYFGGKRLLSMDETILCALFPDGYTKEDLAVLNVTGHLTENYPDVYLMTSTGDFLRSHAQTMDVALNHVGIPHFYRIYGDAKHRPGHVFHCDIRSADAKVCMSDECAFFRKHL